MIAPLTIDGLRRNAHAAGFDVVQLTGSEEAVGIDHEHTRNCTLLRLQHRDCGASFAGTAREVTAYLIGWYERMRWAPKTEDQLKADIEKARRKIEELERERSQRIIDAVKVESPFVPVHSLRRWT